MKDIRQKIERSSLGTTTAQAARRSVSVSRAAEVVARAQAMSKKDPPQSKNLGG